MFQRLSNSWRLVKASASVLRADTELMVFPLLSAVMLVLVTASFALPMFLTENGAGHLQGPLSYAVAFLFYLVSYFVISFCNAALVGAAMIRLRGGDPTVADGFRIALGKIGAIFGYALISATVGMVLRAVQERMGFIGKIVVGIIGMAWSMATFLAVPVLVAEDVSPVDAVKRSMSLLKKTWGEQLVGGFSIGMVGALAAFLLIALFVPLIILAAGSGSGALIAAVIIAFVGALTLLALVNATLSGIYTAAVYRYAAEGDVSAGFEPEMVREAFRSKN